MIEVVEEGEVLGEVYVCDVLGGGEFFVIDFLPVCAAGIGVISLVLWHRVLASRVGRVCNWRRREIVQETRLRYMLLSCTASISTPKIGTGFHPLLDVLNR